MQKKPPSKFRKTRGQSLSHLSTNSLIHELTRHRVYVLALCADDVLVLMPWLTQEEADAVARSVADDQPDELLPMAIEVAAQDLGFPIRPPRKVNYH